MSKERMKFLLASITFDDAVLWLQRWRTDRFAAARPMFELFNKNIPSKFMSIDETLYPMRHQIAFHQYNPKKLDMDCY